MEINILNTYLRLDSSTCHAVAYLFEALCYKSEGRGSFPDEVTDFFVFVVIFMLRTVQKFYGTYWIGTVREN
jgi:hypothetical protein